MAAIEVKGLDVTYPGAPRPVRALAGLDLSVASGEPLTIIGPSGCGKSTLLLAIAGLLPPTAGVIRIDGVPVHGPRLKTALMLQDFGLFPWMTVFRNAALGLRIRGVPKATARKVTMEALEQVGIADFARTYPGVLSGGMRQRLALARALALDADLMLMDEPLSALDALTREGLQRLLLELWRRRGHTQVMVTHSIDEAVFLGRRIAVLSQRPAHVARIVDNPGFGSDSYRSGAGYHAVCDDVRALLAEQGVFAANPLEAGDPA